MKTRLSPVLQNGFELVGIGRSRWYVTNTTDTHVTVNLDGKLLSRPFKVHNGQPVLTGEWKAASQAPGFQPLARPRILANADGTQSWVKRDQSRKPTMVTKGKVEPLRRRMALVNQADRCQCGKQSTGLQRPRVLINADEKTRCTCGR